MEKKLMHKLRENEALIFCSNPQYIVKTLE